MSEGRLNRRLISMLSTRLAEARLDRVKDERDRRGVRWGRDTLLGAALVGLATEARSLADVERVTSDLSVAARRRLGIPRRVPDTTLRENLCSMTPEALRPCLHRLVRAAHRRKALAPDGLPFGVASMDGKATALPVGADQRAQRQTTAAEGKLSSLVRTITTTLTTSAARPCIDVTTVPAATNEMGAFEAALEALLSAYGGGDLFRLVTYDAGACSLHNASLIRARNLHYLLGLTAAQPALFGAARRWLGARAPKDADAVSSDTAAGHVVTRRLYLGAACQVDRSEGWEAHLRTVLRVETVTTDARGKVTVENRYLISSLATDRLTPEQWLLLVRRHWGVEITHQTLDVAFHEDRRPWITHNPRGMLVVAVLRRIAYTLLALFRSVTQRSDARRSVPWKSLFRDVLVALLTATPAQLDGLRRRASAAPS